MSAPASEIRIMAVFILHVSVLRKRGFHYFYGIIFIQCNADGGVKPHSMLFYGSAEGFFAFRRHGIEDDATVRRQYLFHSAYHLFQMSAVSADEHGIRARQ